MLHLDDPDSPQSNQRTVYQIIDLYAEHQPEIDDRPSVFASANFNSAIDDDHELQLYGVQIYAFAEKPVWGSGKDLSEWGRPLAIADRKLAADFDEGSWQNVSAQLNLPPHLPADPCFHITPCPASLPLMIGAALPAHHG